MPTPRISPHNAMAGANIENTHPLEKQMKEVTLWDIIQIIVLFGLLLILPWIGGRP